MNKAINQFKYVVKIGDPFGGYSTIKKDLTKKEAETLQKKEWENCDWFTTVIIEKYNIIPDLTMWHEQE